MNIEGPYLGQLDASLLGSPAPSWCRAPGLATKVLPTRPCTGCPVRCLACNWAQSTGPIPNDGSPLTRAAVNGTYGPLTTQLKTIRQPADRRVNASTAHRASSRASAALKPLGYLDGVSARFRANYLHDMPIVEVVYGSGVADDHLRRLAHALPDAVSLAVECPEEPYDHELQPGDVEIRFLATGPYDVSGLDMVVEVRSK